MVGRERRRRPGRSRSPRARRADRASRSPTLGLRASDEHVEVVYGFLARLADLAPDEREAVQLHAWAGRDEEQIGRALRIPGPTVHDRLSHARAQLGRALLEGD